MKIKVTGSVLCYNIVGEKYEKIQKICSHDGIKVRVAEQDDYKITVGQSMGFSGAKDSNADTSDIEPTLFDDEMMILYNVSGTHLNTFLRKLRDEGIDIPLKAALTDTNKDWIPSRLCEELKKEHEAYYG